MGIARGDHTLRRRWNRCRKAGRGCSYDIACRVESLRTDKVARAVRKADLLEYGTQQSTQLPATLIDSLSDLIARTIGEHGRTQVYLGI